ncbi:MAG: D-inositol-3-phosphate glycosyltransferase [Turneriella sp.]|nr:D-inositol-3-phosphate glycosyltransferase [Turneriella sp.]
MHIGFDAKRAFLNTSGLGNYSRTLIELVVNAEKKSQFTLFTPKLKEENFYNSINNLPNCTIETPTRFIDKSLRSHWRSFGITKLLNLKKIDLYHGLSNELPFNIKNFKGKKIVTIHDLIFLRYPKLYPFIDRKIYNKKFYHACKSADTIIAISQETKNDIINFYSIPQAKIKVVYQSCNAKFYENISRADLDKMLSLYKLPHEYLLYVGTIEERKNLLLIIKALSQVKDIPLVVVGRKRKYFQKVKEQILKLGLQSRVIFLENVANHDLPAIYRQAKIFIYPSFFEGFGIPIVEALASRIPVITTKGSCFLETAGPNSIYINPNNEYELAENINFLLKSKQQRKEQTEKGFIYAQKFHPKTYLNEILKIYNV